jgi:Oxidoreductase family, NAD-binding Rossmann fold
MSALSLGLIGTGTMAARMVTALHRHGGALDARFVAVAGRDAQRTQRFATALGIARAHESVEALLADASLDAVYIANASADHATTTLAALRAGKAVLCEKPIATRAAQAREIENVARATGLLAMEAMWTLCLPSWRALIEAAAAALTNPLHLQADFGYPETPVIRPRLFEPGPGSGVLLDRAVYPVALALSLFGAPRRVSGVVAVGAQGVDEHAALTLAHEGGHTSQLAASWRHLLPNRATLAAPDGLWTLEPPLLGSEALRHDGWVASGAPADPIDAGRSPPGLGDRLRSRPALRRLSRALRGGSVRALDHGADIYLPLLAHFTGLLRARRGASPWVPLDLSCAVLGVLDEARSLPTLRWPETAP